MVELVDNDHIVVVRGSEVRKVPAVETLDRGEEMIELRRFVPADQEISEVLVI
ncbi:hypothetical protein DSECCO2_518450 [anaerobic digester metagenome]